MKKILTLSIILISAFAITASAQSKKAKTRKKVATQKTTQVTKAEAKPAAATTTTQTRPATPALPAPAKRSTPVPVDNDYYKTALGIKFLYGISITGKHFLNEKGALEVIVQYRSIDGLGSEINVTAVYEYHGKIAGAPGLRWYVGGGGYFGYLHVDDDQFGALVGSSSQTSFGVVGAVGLEYKIKNIPVAISADWQPVYVVNDGGGFTSANGGFGIKYTF